MRRIALLAAALAVLVLIGFETWLSVRTLALPDPFAGSPVNPFILIGANMHKPVR